MLPIKLLRSLFKLILLLIVLVVAFRIAEQLPKKLYPTPYQDTVMKYADQYAVDPLLVYAVMKAESGFQETAQSNKNALGLMQVTEETAKWAGGKIGLSIETRADVLNVQNNIQLGTWFLSYLLEQYNGDWINVLCAYNAGSGNVAKWLKEEEHSSDGVNLENIPFPETKKYVEKVYRYYDRYQQYYGDQF